MATRRNNKKTPNKKTKAAAGKPAVKKKTKVSAKAKPAVKKASAAKKTSARRKAAAAYGTVAAPADLVEVLTALPEKYDEAIDVSVPTILGEAAELLGIGQEVGPQIIAHSRLVDGVFDDLLAREQRLDHAQRAWLANRRRTSTTALTAARSAAEALEGKLFSELRHFVDDAEVQLRLDEIQVGDNDNDTVQDLKDLADLADAHASSLTKARLPADIGQQARAAAETLEGLTTSMAVANVSADAQAMRNKAYWHLRELMDEIRGAGRHVFQDDSRRRKWFLASSTRSLKRSAIGRPRKAKPVQVVESNPTAPKDEPKE